VPLLVFVFYAGDSKWCILSDHRYIVCRVRVPFYVFARVDVIEL